PATGLVALILLEISLGAATWVTKYGWPNWIADRSWAADYVIQEGSGLQVWATTAHVAMGSMVLATSLLLALRSARFAWQVLRPVPFSGAMEAAR
ncbi:MAG TPA: hypothetical protein VGZ26_06705, partial [Pirellulales bacterium]|nr:hypothetical protein [Pirellulales bacterium]